MDISLNEDPTPSSDSVAPSSDLVEPKSPKKKSLTGTLSRMFGKDKEKNSSQDGMSFRFCFAMVSLGLKAHALL